ncbi:MAG TPA: sigma-70 family RNA polymerase sigma factor [bacterium]|nr:sigma-70 family RNA polymerase sigma factor [bacterium]HQG46095.1 sigma-70 family RNA polymerase sigma factor [bacterium]HQI48384.1 sigma-70 family RNA polymerase sigma factor [bacterium]HQJ63743.1 sigma-70 family RNA polymerase sigma factor [bacterium]
MRATDLTSDADLIRAWQQGDADAFDQLLQRYQRPLFAYLLRLVQERNAAQDLFQETFLRVIRALPGYQERARFGSWIFGIAHHLAIDHHRKSKWSRQARRFSIQRLLLRSRN